MLFRSRQGLLVLTALAALGGCHASGASGLRYGQDCQVCLDYAGDQRVPATNQPVPSRTFPTPAPPVLPLPLPLPAPPAESRPLPSRDGEEVTVRLGEWGRPERFAGDAIAEPLEPQQRLAPIPEEDPGWFARLSAQVQAYFSMQ